jgi:hypothetical protein
MDPMCVQLDWLTVTMSGPTAGYVLPRLNKRLGRWGEKTSAEPGKAVQGFECSERYPLASWAPHLCMWRRWKPRTASKAFGLEYESWEISGCSAVVLEQILLEAPRLLARATRIDVAFDFACDEDLWPRHLEAEITSHAERRGFTIQYAGERDARTVYVGSRSAGRRVRIYRHDVKHGGTHPQMRIELELSGERYPRELWNRWDTRGGEGLALARWHVGELIGCVPEGELREADPIEQVPRCLVRAMTSALRCYGSVLRAYSQAGGDLRAALKAACREDDREQLRREKLYQDSVAGWTPEHLQSKVLQAFELARELTRRRRARSTLEQPQKDA